MHDGGLSGRLGLGLVRFSMVGMIISDRVSVSVSERVTSEFSCLKTQRNCTNLQLIYVMTLNTTILLLLLIIFSTKISKNK